MKTSLIKILTFVISLSLITNGCQQPEKTNQENKTKIEKPVKWSKNAIIYEVNIRQYTPEGTINAFAKHLPELNNLGVDILWLMPIFPIGEQNRKGSLGSAYAVEDYRAVNPDYGTMDDLKNLVQKAHELGMHVILDWVANHTAWDNPLTKEHPDWYLKDSTGSFMPPVADWADVIDLNYDNEELRNYMSNSLEFWIKEADVDGFRCDVAGMVPTDFWDNTRAKLDSIKPVFMLAEAEQPDLMSKAFDMYYGWEFYHIMNQIAQGKMNVSDLDTYLQKNKSEYEADDYRMNFTTNHDENSWNGTVRERLGDAAETMATLTYMIPGMPLIYSGQEAGLNKRLEFFEKDTIQWIDTPWRALYTKLNSLKKENPALWNGEYGGSMVRIHTDVDNSVFAIQRNNEDHFVIAIFNLSDKAQKATIADEINAEEFTNYFNGETQTLEKGTVLELGPWEYIILTK